MNILAKISIFSVVAFANASMQAAMTTGTFENKTDHPIAIIHNKKIGHISANRSKVMDVDTDKKFFVYTNLATINPNATTAVSAFEVYSNIFSISTPNKSVTVTFYSPYLAPSEIVVGGGELLSSDSSNRQFSSIQDRKAYNKSQVDIFMSLQMSKPFYEQHLGK